MGKINWNINTKGNRLHTSPNIHMSHTHTCPRSTHILEVNMQQTYKCPRHNFSALKKCATSHFFLWLPLEYSAQLKHYKGLSTAEALQTPVQHNFSKRRTKGIHKYQPPQYTCLHRYTEIQYIPLLGHYPIRLITNLTHRYTGLLKPCTHLRQDIFSLCIINNT